MSGRTGAAVGGTLHTHHIGAHGHLSLHLKITTQWEQLHSYVYTYRPIPQSFFIQDESIHTDYLEIVYPIIGEFQVLMKSYHCFLKKQNV